MGGQQGGGTQRWEEVVWQSGGAEDAAEKGI